MELHPQHLRRYQCLAFSKRSRTDSASFLNILWATACVPGPDLVAFQRSFVDAPRLPAWSFKALRAASVSICLSLCSLPALILEMVLL